MSNPQIIRSSLLADTLAVAVDSIDALSRPRLLLLKVSALEDQKLRHYEIFGSNVLNAVANAQKKLTFDVLVAYGSDGRNLRRYTPPPEVANAPEDALSYIARLNGNKLVVQDLEDAAERSEAFTRLMSVEVGGEVMIFQGTSLSDCIRNSRRFLIFDELFFDEPPKPQRTKKPTLHPHAPKPLPANDLWNVFR
jgi:hypothetical protein